jgi:hypothetical protein
MASEAEGQGPGKSGGVLAEKRLRRSGLEVKLDKGFANGTYCLYCEYDQLASRVGFVAARRTAMAYCALLKKHWGQPAGWELGETHDDSRTGDPRRKYDLEATFLWFPIHADDGRFRDEAMRHDFEVAALRAGQAWDQSQAKAQDQRRSASCAEFRRQLADLLKGPAYVHLDEGTKERLQRDMAQLVYRPRGLEP